MPHILTAITLPRPHWPRDKAILLFGPEWLAVGAVALLDLVLAQRIHFHLIMSWNNVMGTAAFLGAALLLHLFGYPRGRLVLEYTAIVAAGTAVLCVLSYVSFAMSGPLIDNQLLAIDRMMGFDWLSGFRFFNTDPRVASLLTLLYQSPGVQELYFVLLFGLTNDKARLRGLFWLFLIALLITCAGSWLFPAYGPFKIFGLESHGNFLSEMEHLKSGHDLTFVLSHMTGVICFPSFHTTLAAIFIYGFRRTGPIGVFVAGINSAMLLAIPFVGGHYLIDMIAGAGIALVSIAAVEWGPSLWRRYLALPAQRLPQTQMADPA